MTVERDFGDEVPTVEDEKAAPDNDIEDVDDDAGEDDDMEDITD